MPADGSGMGQRTDATATACSVPPPRSVADLRERLAAVLVRLDQLELELAADLERARDLKQPLAQARFLEIEQLRLRIKCLTGAIRLRQVVERPIAASTIGRK
jgi:uncharacterized protein involved in exopolysaccharide biosynthesis